MNYQEFVYDTFINHEMDLGIMCREEIEDTIQENSFKSVERWLIRSGYDLKKDYENMLTTK